MKYIVIKTHPHASEDLFIFPDTQPPIPFLHSNICRQTLKLPRRQNPLLWPNISIRRFLHPQIKVSPSRPRSIPQTLQRILTTWTANIATNPKTTTWPNHSTAHSVGNIASSASHPSTPQIPSLPKNQHPPKPQNGLKVSKTQNHLPHLPSSK
jgi:hypothetical protein